MGTILLGTLLIGTIDILWAMGNTMLQGRNPVTVLQTIAGGLLGRSALDGGAATAAMGLGLHFLIACAVMTTFYLASRRFPDLVRRPWLWGPLYGVVVYVVMYQLVLPLSAWHTKGITGGAQLYKALFIHIFGVGLVAALVARRGAARTARPQQA